MKFDSLVARFGTLACFDLPMAVQISGEPRAALRTQLHRWIKAGKVLPLRRGMYSLADRYRRCAVNPAALAHVIYTPSYLSGAWAMSYYGLIPEYAAAHTSITTRVPRRFRNAFGEFVYRHVKQDYFFGYRVAEIHKDKVMIAEPEKALLDFWYLEKGEWSQDRMAGMRFQNSDAIDPVTLSAYLERFNSPRLSRAVEVWLEHARSESEGTVQL